MRTFLDGKKPLVAMIQCRTPEQCIKKIKASLRDGAEALGIQLCRLDRQYRTKETISGILSACEDKPVYITAYRFNNVGMTDEESARLLLTGLDCGAALCDIIGDLFCPNNHQITEDEDAVKKQKDLIKTIHEKGGEVLISTHDFRELTADEIFRVASLQSEHGADIIKIVVRSESLEMLPEYLSVIQKVNREIKKPFLLLDTGACSDILRKVGPDLGTCMYLCVESHGEFDPPQQPVLKNLKQIRDNMRNQNLEG